MQVNVSWEAADNLCKSTGKRLCDEIEWERASKGAENIRYPYGNEFDADATLARKMEKIVRCVLQEPQSVAKALTGSLI